MTHSPTLVETFFPKYPDGQTARQVLLGVNLYQLTGQAVTHDLVVISAKYVTPPKIGQTALHSLVVGSANNDGIEGHFCTHTLNPVLLSPYHVVGQISIHILSFDVA